MPFAFVSLYLALSAASTCYSSPAPCLTDSLTEIRKMTLRPAHRIHLMLATCLSSRTRTDCPFLSSELVFFSLPYKVGKTWGLANPAFDIRTRRWADSYPGTLGALAAASVSALP